MRILSLCFLLLVLASCRDETTSKKVTNNNAPSISIQEDLTDTDEVLLQAGDNVKIMLLSEKSLDTFSLPFPEKNLLADLQNYYHSYQVTAQIGQQDGPDFPYIDITTDDDRTMALLSFNDEDIYKLEEIRILDSLSTDEYGIRVGDTYQEVISKRTDTFQNYTDYHAHTYLYGDNSNIFYELSCDQNGESNGPDISEGYEMSEAQLKRCKVAQIIWRPKHP